MKQRIAQIATIILLLAILPLALLLSGAALPSYYSESYYAELADMYDRLYSTQGKKIIIVGGSSVAFGVDTALMEQLLEEKGYDYTVCSFGLYAAVGTSAMLDLSEESLQAGDIVILAIEPTSETMSTYFGATAFWKCAEDAHEMLTKLAKSKQAALWGNYISYLQERWSIFEDGTTPVIQDVYAKSSFNGRCDLIYDRPGNTMALGFDTASPIDLNTLVIAEDFISQVNEYCTAAAQKNASVIMSFSPMNRSAMTDADSKTLESYFTLCNETFVCPIISDPNDYVMDSGWFYDSNFHLNSPGTVFRTVTLASDILAYLGCYQPVEYPLPSMPASIAQIEVNEASTDYFRFIPISGGAGYLISGLTELGLNQKQLTAPSAYDGKPVVGFSADALGKATGLVELRIPESIESLPDYLFQNCLALERLILEHNSKTCAISENPFVGVEGIKIFVPTDSLALYRDGAGCETNPWAVYWESIFTYG